jgi:hypothetical protein
MRGRPTAGLAVAMRVISALISALMGGRFGRAAREPGPVRAEVDAAAYRRTVSGVMMTRDFPAGSDPSQPDPEEASVRRNRGRVIIRL